MGLKPSFSALNIDIEDSLTISYENINTSNFICSINADGVNASILEDSDYLQCEVEAIEGVEFGELTVSAISADGTIMLAHEDIEAYLNGTLVFYDKDNVPQTQ